MIYCQFHLLLGTVASSQVTLSQLIEVSLWGNKCDLSLSAGDESSQKTDPLSQLDFLRENILQNEIAQLAEYLRSDRKAQVGGNYFDR